jgi:hypothetical protein
MSKRNPYKHAPVYAPHAIPSPEGWRDPRTNELLVAIKLNMSDFDNTSNTVTEEVQPEVVEQTEEVQEVQQPAKRSRTSAK